MRAARASFVLILSSLLSLMLAACQAEKPPSTSFDPASIRFSGRRALEIETQFVQRFPNRHSGQPNNAAAATWLMEQLQGAGLACKIDAWEIINYSRPFPLNNVVCELPGESEKEILVIAHFDQAPTTVQGADNDGSGIAILLELAEIVASEPQRRYKMAFVATDGEEYGMLGSGRYIQTHPNPRNVVAGISLDNLGRTYYDGMNMELIGQFRGYGPIWLAQAAREAARAAGAEWPVNLRTPFDQITDQAAPVSFMDQGPLVAAGVPALGLAGHVPAAFTEQHFHLWHDPDDTLQFQSAKTLAQSGLIAEALVRQLQGMESFPAESGPYLYFDRQGQVLRGLPLMAIFAAFVLVFLAASLFVTRRPVAAATAGWLRAAPHFLSLWLPLVTSIALLYAMVAAGLMDKYYRYPATTKDPLLYHPRWPAVIVFVCGLGLLLYLGRRLARRSNADPDGRDIKSLAMLIVGLGGLYLLLINPFGLFFMVPLLCWLLITWGGGRRRALDIVLFLLGGVIVYALIYIFGFVVLRLDFAFLWYLMNMFSIRMISFPLAMVIMAIVAAGLSMLVMPTKTRPSA